MKANQRIWNDARGWARICRFGNAAILILFSSFFFLLPGLTVIHQLADANIRSAGIPRFTWEFHRTLSAHYEKWARARLNLKQAVNLTVDDISGTEWPLFGTAFYLWATEGLQEAWEKNPAASAIAPNVYAKGAIEAAADLLADPAQANWVKIHYGTNYLKTENVFYRMLVISVLTCHARLTGERQYLPLLRDQADSLAAELDASRHGLLEDYPGECYPGDVLAAIAMIHRADLVLGTDHSAFVSRARRGFQSAALDPRGLVPYAAEARLGTPDGPARGCGNSYVSTFAPGIWPEQAQRWYELYSRYYWQEKGTCVGFREYPNDLPGNNWYADVDSGPVLGGYGCSACAFGVGAARANGHFEQAYPLTAEMLVASWPLPNGARLLPRLFSNAADAPYLGEAAILFNLTRLPGPGVTVKTGGSIPNFVWVFLLVQLGLGSLFLVGAIQSLRFWSKYQASVNVPQPRLQFKIWVVLVIFGVVLGLCGEIMIALLVLVCAQLFPRLRKMPPTQMVRRQE